MFNLSSMSKAIVGGVATLVAALLAKYGLHPSMVTTNALGVIETAAVGYVTGHVAVYLAPKNKEIAPIIKAVESAAEASQTTTTPIAPAPPEVSNL